MKPVSTPFIIPVFIPQAGCPHRCIFCDQTAITGVRQGLSGSELNAYIHNFLRFNRTPERTVQVAFYGGNFLGLSAGKVRELLRVVDPFISAGKVHGIRFSTRPDTIDRERLERLRGHRVHMVELGAQSMDDGVLDLSRRGHTADDTTKAVACLKSNGYNVGLQMMVGLPGDSEDKSLQTARRIARLRPQCVRIYPAVVLVHSPLARWYREGRFLPLSLAQAVSLVKRLWRLFNAHHIPVIRMGLQASDDLQEGTVILSGPYHPAFGHLVHSEIFLDRAAAMLKKMPVPLGKIRLGIHPRNESKMRGLHNNNVARLKNAFQIDSLTVAGDPALEADEIRITRMEDNKMKLYAMACGKVRCRLNIFLPAEDKDRWVEMPLPVFLITHPRGCVLFDTGPHPNVFNDPAAQWGGLAKAFQPIGDQRDAVLPQLAKIGFGPSDIKSVVMSHLHFDHAGGNQFFPDATFLVSREELACAENPAHEGQGYFRADWNHPLDYRAIDGTYDIYGDGKLTIVPLPGHTPGHQGLLVRLPDQGPVVLGGDCAPFKAQYEDRVVPKNNMDNRRALEAIESLHRLVDKEKALLIHGHDPEQWAEVKKAPEFYC